MRAALDIEIGQGLGKHEHVLQSIEVDEWPVEGEGFEIGLAVVLGHAFEVESVQLQAVDYECLDRWNHE